MRKRLFGAVGSGALMIALLAGCGTPNNTSTNSTAGGAPANSAASTTVKTSKSGGKTIMEGATQYQGSANLKKYTDAAKKNTSNEKAQISAGVASYVNGDFDQAITYYKKASALNPKDAVPLNNIGNVYLRGKKDPKSAIPWYQKATKADPTYGFGWWNLAIAESGVGNNTAAKAAVANGLKDVKKSDPVYASLQKMQKQLSTPSTSK